MKTQTCKHTGTYVGQIDKWFDAHAAGDETRKAEIARETEDLFYSDNDAILREFLEAVRAVRKAFPAYRRNF